MLSAPPIRAALVVEAILHIMRSQVTAWTAPAGDDALTAHLNMLRGNTTVLFVTARPSHMRVADRVLVMGAGVVVASGKPDTIVPTIVEGIQTNAA